MRHDQRRPGELRPLKIQRGFRGAAPGSVLVQAGRTSVLCAASVRGGRAGVARRPGTRLAHRRIQHVARQHLPAQTPRRGPGLDGRTTEIQRFIGRSLRAVTDLAALGERTATIDCDVLEADGGTRTLSVTGGFVALVDALRAVLAELPDPARLPLAESVAAVSVGIVAGEAVLDLDYEEDFAAAVDMNVVMTGGGRFVEVQGTGEEATFSEQELHAMLALARGGVVALTAAQREALGDEWPQFATAST